MVPPKIFRHTCDVANRTANSKALTRNIVSCSTNALRYNIPCFPSVVFSQRLVARPPSSGKLDEGKIQKIFIMVPGYLSTRIVLN